MQYSFSLTLKHLGATIFAVVKPIVIAHSECVFVALSLHHAIGIRRIFICDLFGFIVFFYIIK